MFFLESPIGRAADRPRPIVIIPPMAVLGALKKVAPRDGICQERNLNLCRDFAERAAHSAAIAGCHSGACEKVRAMRISGSPKSGGFYSHEVTARRRHETLQPTVVQARIVRRRSRANGGIGHVAQSGGIGLRHHLRPASAVSRFVRSSAPARIALARRGIFRI